MGDLFSGWNVKFHYYYEQVIFQLSPTKPTMGSSQPDGLALVETIQLHLIAARPEGLPTCLTFAALLPI